MTRSIGLIGLGPHARRIYYPQVERAVQAGAARLTCVIDVAAEEAAVRGYLAHQKIRPDHLLFLPTAERHAAALSPAAAALLRGLLGAGQLDGLIISCDPRAHAPYARWALAHDRDVLMDKPLTAPDRLRTDPAQAARLLDDYEDLARRHAASRAHFVVQAQRRAHPGYRFVLDTVRQAVTRYGVPLSSIDIAHADGMWVMPHEWERDNHPYKYGFGKLLHSGYHFVDLLALLLGCNDALGQGPRHAEVLARAFTPEDALAQVGPAQLQRIFSGQGGATAARDPAALAGYGELDVFALLQVQRAGRVQTTAQLALQQHSFSRRAWTATPQDGYKGNGRVRHERLTVQVGPLLSVQVHSYQADEVGRAAPRAYGPGHLDHFDVSVFRNSALLGGPAFEQIPFGADAPRATPPLYLGHNEQARESLFLDFLLRRPSPSDLREHHRTHVLLAALYRALIARAAVDVAI